MNSTFDKLATALLQLVWLEKNKENENKLTKTIRYAAVETDQ